MDKLEMTVKKKTHFKRDFLVPGEDSIGEEIVKMMNRKSFTPEQIENLKRAGAKIKETIKEETK